MSNQAYSRNQLYALLAIGKKELGWGDDYYRLWLADQGAREANGRVTASSMSFPQLMKALEAMKCKGFMPKRKHFGTALHTADWRRPMIAKLNAMWIELAEHGHVHDRSEAAMARFCCNQVRDLTKLEWGTSKQINAAIEALKQWQTRVGLGYRRLKA